MCCQSAEGDSRAQGLAPVNVQTRQISRHKITTSRARLTCARAVNLEGAGAEPCGRTDLAALFRRRSKERHEKSSLLGCCRVAYRVRADDDAHRSASIACADHSDFSSISRSRTPNVDHCGFGLPFHLLSNPTGLHADAKPAEHD